jgi:hypothetical protein
MELKLKNEYYYPSAFCQPTGHTKSCNVLPPHARSGKETCQTREYNVYGNEPAGETEYGDCQITECDDFFTLDTEKNQCIAMGVEYNHFADLERTTKLSDAFMQKPYKIGNETAPMDELRDSCENWGPAPACDGQNKKEVYQSRKCIQYCKKTGVAKEVIETRNYKCPYWGDWVSEDGRQCDPDDNNRRSFNQIRNCIRGTSNGNIGNYECSGSSESLYDCKGAKTVNRDFTEFTV